MQEEFLPDLRDVAFLCLAVSTIPGGTVKLTNLSAYSAPSPLSKLLILHPSVDRFRLQNSRFLLNLTIPASLHPFVTDHVEPGATVFTDGWQGYHGLERLGYVHARRSQRAARARGEDTGELLPAVHRVASLAKRWLLGTHQGSVEPAHLGSYLNEFVFRFNRRRSRSRGMVFYRVLELAAAHEPVRYQDLIATKRPRAVSPTPPEARGHPPSLDRPPANRPWRTASPDGSG